MEIASSSSSDSESSSDLEVLHELVHKINLGLANANCNNGTDSVHCSLSAAVKEDSGEKSEQTANDSITTEFDEVSTLNSSATVPGNSSKDSDNIKREPLLRRNASFGKVVEVLNSISLSKTKPVPSNESPPKHKLNLNSETLLILNLLAMNSAERQKYLIDIAKKRKLLLTNEKTKTFNVNPELLVADLPQVVDFVHQFQGKPIQLTELPKLSETSSNVVMKAERKLKKRAKEKAAEQLKKQKEKSTNRVINSHQTIEVFQLPSSKKQPKSAQSVSNVPTLASHVKEIVNISEGNKRKSSLSESSHQTVDSILVQRHDVAEAFSKRQQRRLVKQMKAASILSNVEKATCGKADVEKVPRKRGRRGSKKGVDETPEKEMEIETVRAALPRNIIRNKCSQISAEINKKMSLLASTQPASSKSQNQTDDRDLVIEAIVNQSDDDDLDDVKSSSVTSDSSNFPTDEETTSYFARSDEIESSCNEKRSESTAVTNLTKETAEMNLTGGVTALDDPATASAVIDDTTVSKRVQSSLQTMQAISTIPKVNKESLLIMSLLTLPEKEQNYFLQQAALDCHIFVQKQNKTVLNQKLVDIRNVFKSESINKFIATNSNQKTEKESFETDVNRLVRRYLPESDYHLYELDSRNKSAVRAFANKLVADNLGRIIEGDVRINEYDNHEAYMTNDEDERDVFFSTLLLRQCALHCSRVKAFVFTAEDRNSVPNGKKIVRGFVIEVLDDQSRKIVGKFDLRKSKTSSLVFIPDDRRVPRVKIDKSSDPELFSKIFLPKGDSLYLVQLKFWRDKRPYGFVVEEIGKVDELETGNRAVLLKNFLKPLVFTESTMEALPKEPYVISESEYKIREVLTKDCIFTIDPISARDLDDAVSCKKLENGNYEIGVHISDVSHFVIENSELDNMIKDQTTTIYLVNTVYHMLPRELCMLCSLLPGKDKLTFSVFWEMTPDAKILNTRFSKTVINSCAQLAYEHAQMIIDQPNKEFEDSELPQIHNGFNHRDLSNVINTLNSMAVILRKDRFDKGCISINQTKIVFDLNDSGLPIAFRPADRKESNFLIEEFMLLANQSVAKFIYEKFPQIAVLRKHAPPKSNMMEELVAKMNGLKLHMDISSSKAISDSMAAIIRKSGHNDAVTAVLNSMLAKPMVRADYFCSSYVTCARALVHYALSIPIYTHFTSPIRRYPDILVHRLLAAGLSLGPIPTRTPDELKLITRNCNDQKYNAKLAGEDSTNLYFIHYLRSFGPIKMRAAVRDLSKGAELHLMLIDSGHNVRVNIKQNVPELKFEFPENGSPTIQFIGCENAPTISVNIFDVVQVEVYAKDELLKARLLAPN